MYIDAIPTTKHLIPITSLIQDLRSQLDDLEWDGYHGSVRAEVIRNQLHQLEANRASGVEYIPLF